MIFEDYALGADEVGHLLSGRHSDPHGILGAHPAGWGVVVRALHPDAISAECLLEHESPVPMTQFGDTGVFTAFLPGRKLPLPYRFRFRFPGGAVWEQDDPYRFLPSLGAVDEHLLSEGTHRRLWTVLGAHARRIDGVSGVAFAVWAPSALGVSVVGDFCRWDERRLPMRRVGA
ncbi:MAG: 1,4-alpha-glucan branching enzyme, partial [Gemmatimonadales bacterium]